MAQFTIRDLVAQRDRLGLTLAAGPVDDRTIDRVEVLSLDQIDRAPRGTLVIIGSDDPPPPFRVDVSLRHAIARELAGLVFATELGLAETARTLAARGGVPVFAAPDITPADLALAVDRTLAGGASEAMTRAADTVARATEAAADADATTEDILEAAGRALGTPLRLVPDTTANWTDADAVCIGEVPIGRVVAASTDAATNVAVPVIASLLSRAAQRHMRDRFAPTQSRADLILEMVLAEPSRVEGFVGQAGRLGFPLQLAHAVAWLSPTSLVDPDLRVPRGVEPALELYTLQLVEGREEMWHVTFVQDDMLLIGTEEHGAGDHQRRVREVAEQIQARASTLAGEQWAYTVGLGTPQLGAAGLRQSAAEARIAAESAITAGRPGSVQLTDVTGLRRILLDLYVSPISRALLHDILEPLDGLGPERAMTATRTLLSYLSHRNSLVHAGRELMLHPNAVGYRLKRIRELLLVDLDDPDTRFSVELACRVRLLTAQR